MSLFQTYLEKVQGNKPATVSDLREFLKSNNLLKKNSQEEIFADYARTLTSLMDKGVFNTDDESKKYLNDLISSNDSKYKMEIKNNRLYFSIKAKETKPIVEKPTSSKPVKSTNPSSTETTQSTETTPKNDVLISSDGTRYKIIPANEQGYFTVTSKKSNESNYSPFPGKDKDKNRLMESIKKEVKQESRNKNKIVKIGKE